MTKELLQVAPAFSPRMWRCFWQMPESAHIREIFSTYVEVFLEETITFEVPLNFLHVCGGVS